MSAACASSLGRVARGRRVHVEIYYGMPGGSVAARAAELVSMAPESVLYEDLRRLKQLTETGEIATTRGQSSGVRSVIGRVFSKGAS